MTAPNTDQPIHPAASMTFEEIEEQMADDPKVSLDAKLDGETVPEEFRGKSVAELVQQFSAISSSLKTSEQARLELQQRMDAVHAGQPTAPTAPQPTQPADGGEKELSREELKKLHEEDPIAAMEYMNKRAAKIVADSIDQRLAPLVSSNSASAEERARQKYKDEFELFGPQIREVIGTIPDAEKRMTTDKSWDDLVAYIRGQGANFDKLVEHRAAKKNAEAQAAAQANQAAAAGFHVAPSSPPASSGESLITDTTTREIAKGLIAAGMFKDESEYLKWSKVR